MTACPTPSTCVCFAIMRTTAPFLANVNSFPSLALATMIRNVAPTTRVKFLTVQRTLEFVQLVPKIVTMETPAPSICAWLELASTR